MQCATPLIYFSSASNYINNHCANSENHNKFACSNSAEFPLLFSSHPICCKFLSGNCMMLAAINSCWIKIGFLSISPLWAGLLWLGTALSNFLFVDFLFCFGKGFFSVLKIELQRLSFWFIWFLRNSTGKGGAKFEDCVD